MEVFKPPRGGAQELKGCWRETRKDTAWGARDVCTQVLVTVVLTINLAHWSTSSAVEFIQEMKVL